MNSINLKGVEYTPEEFNKKFGLLGMTQLKKFMDKSTINNTLEENGHDTNYYWIDLSILSAYCGKKSIVID